MAVDNSTPWPEVLCVPVSDHPPFVFRSDSKSVTVKKTICILYQHSHKFRLQVGQQKCNGTNTRTSFDFRSDSKSVTVKKTTCILYRHQFGLRLLLGQQNYDGLKDNFFFVPTTGIGSVFYSDSKSVTV